MVFLKSSLVAPAPLSMVVQRMNAELIFNLWYVIDSSSGYGYAVSGRAYMASGTDDEKLALLKKLSSTDYMLAKPLPLPQRFSVTDGKETIRGVAHPATAKDPNSQFFEEVFRYIENILPEKISYAAGEPRMIKLTIPDNPLCVTTALLEDENGSIMPVVTKEQSEKLYHLIKSKLI